jgi:hypothetical protein
VKVLFLSTRGTVVSWAIVQPTSSTPWLVVYPAERSYGLPISTGPQSVGRNLPGSVARRTAYELVPDQFWFALRNPSNT